MKDNRFRGIIAPVVTPFDGNEELDKAAFRAEVKFLLSTGIHGISPGGSTGEGSAITDGELAAMIELIQEENNGRIPVVAGIIRQSAKAAITAGLAAKKAGTTALMVTPTSYLGGADDAGNIEFYQRVSDKTQMRIIIYNVIAQNEIKPEVFRKILDESGVIGIKQSVGGIQAMLDMQCACGDATNIYCATDDMLMTGFEFGADGAIAAILGVFPVECVELWDAIQAGDIGKAQAIHDRLYPVWNKIKSARFPRGVKQAINLLGRNVGICRSPVSGASEAEKNEIGTALGFC
jgi:dihydrodipicolinate synthase/N-acetylneuraminate lyase